MMNKRNKKFLCAVLCVVWLGGMMAAYAEDGEDARFQYMEKRQGMVKEYGFYPFWPLEKKVELDMFQAEIGTLLPDEPVHELPSPEDITPERATEIAKEMIEEAYGIDAADLEELMVGYEFLKFREGDSYWRLSFSSGTQGYVAEIESPGEMPKLCEERGDLMTKPGTTVRLPKEEGEIDAEEAEAIARAYAAIHAIGYRGLTAEILDDYHAYVSLWINEELGRVYSVELNPLDPEVYDYFGGYSIDIDPQTGIVWEGYKGNG